MLSRDKSIVVRTSLVAFFQNHGLLAKVLPYVERVNVAFLDVESFSEENMEAYREALSRLADAVKREYLDNHPVQLNLLTDRMMLTEMNNCGAGDSTITLAPDGRFYVCPAFYAGGAGNRAVGDLVGGVNIPNQRLYLLRYAPICRICDAFQCHRCIWLNERTTLEVNTPSHQQCLMAHIERNASRSLLLSIREAGEFLPETEIKEIDYLDPFDIIKR